MKRISIAGIDGSGKTTLVSSLKDEHHESVLFLPQTYKDSTLPLYELSKAIDEIGKWADLNNYPAMKGISLFLGMTLYQPIVDYIEKKKNPQRLVVERHPIIDTIAYSKFFQPMLNVDLPEEKIYLGLKGSISNNQLNLVQNHIKNILGNYTLITINYFIFDLLNDSPEKVFNNLKTFYQINPPDLHILLTLTKEAIPQRLSDRKVVSAHENMKILTMLQQEMITACEFIKKNSVNFDYKVIDARKSVSQVKLEILDILRF